MKHLKAYLSADAQTEFKEYIKSKGLELVELKALPNVDSPVAAHADIMMCELKDRIYFGDLTRLGGTYPNDVMYNAAAVGEYLICSRWTDPQLITESGLTPVLVRQAYVKCNLAVLDERHVITEDRGIASVIAEKTDIECLLIAEHQVSLKGYPYGFIGGACVRIGDELIFNGSIKSHSDYPKIRAFAESAGLNTIGFDSYELCDIGSVIIERV